MKRARNLFHALTGLAAIAVAGWLLAQPWMAKGMHAHSGERAAAAAVICALILVVLVSLYHAIRGNAEPAKKRGGFSYAAFGGKRR